MTRDIHNPEIHRGSCLCGEVRFELAGRFEGFFLCHCQHCQKDTGSAHAANLFSSQGQLEWLSGKQRVKTFRLPGTRHARSFCQECGSAVPTLASESGPVVVPAGSLDSKLGILPDAHLFCASRADWDDRLEDLPRFDALPDR